MKTFSIPERRKSRRKFGETEVCKGEKIRKYFVNPKIEIEVFSYIIFSSDFKNISCALFLFHMKTMNGVVSWYILALHYLFHFIACVWFLSIFFFLFFLAFFQRVNFQVINLVVLNFELPSTFLYALCELFEK